MSQNFPQNQEKDLHGNVHDSLAFIIGLITSFFISPFIIVFTKDFVIPFAGAITGGLLTDFTAGFVWGACVYGGVFSATTYFIHIKLTVMGTKMITNQFESEAAYKNQKSKNGTETFLKGIIFTLLILLVIVLLSGTIDLPDISDVFPLSADKDVFLSADDINIDAIPIPP